MVRRFREYCAVPVAAAWLCAASCAVFPDRAILPTPEAAGSAGSAGQLGGGAAGRTSGGTAAVAGDSSTTAGEAGAESLAGAGGAAGSAGAIAAAGESGSAGAASSSECSVRHALVATSGDAWIAAGEPRVNHGSDTQLFVLGGASEQRALLSFTLPQASANDVLLRATLVLTLSQPPNLGAGAALFSVRTLQSAFDESRVTWLNYANGASRAWNTPGGDVGLDSATGELYAADVVLRADVSALVRAARTAQRSELPLLVRDARAAGLMPVSSAFAAREGAPAAVPYLDFEYCQ